MASAPTRDRWRSKRTMEVGRWSCRTNLAAQTTTASSATGLTTMKASSAGGNAPSAPGCTQYDVTESEAAHA